MPSQIISPPGPFEYGGEVHEIKELGFMMSVCAFARTYVPLWRGRNKILISGERTEFRLSVEDSMLPSS